MGQTQFVTVRCVPHEKKDEDRRIYWPNTLDSNSTGIKTRSRPPKHDASSREIVGMSDKSGILRHPKTQRLVDLAVELMPLGEHAQADIDQVNPGSWKFGNSSAHFTLGKQQSGGENVIENAPPHFARIVLTPTVAFVSEAFLAAASVAKWTSAHPGNGSSSKCSVPAMCWSFSW